MENNEDDMIFTVVTPAGKAYADFTMEDEPVKWSGDPLALRIVAAAFDVIGFTGSDGYSLSMNALDPDEFYNFCNSAENGMIIIPPFSYLEYLAEKERESATFDSLAEAAKSVNTSPTDAQKEAGNYAKGFVTLHGLKAVIENPKGSVRSGIDAGGKPWESTMNAHYGYFSGSEGADGDHVDVFFGDEAESDNPRIFIVNQVDNEYGAFDEHKVMFGYADIESAKKAYLGNYEKGWNGLGSIKEIELEKFKEWLFSEKTKITFDRLFIESEILAHGTESLKNLQRLESLHIRHYPIVKVVQDDYDDGIQDLVITHEDGSKFAVKREWKYGSWDEYDKINDTNEWSASERYKHIVANSKLLARKELNSMSHTLDSVNHLITAVMDSVSLTGMEKMKLVRELSGIRTKVSDSATKGMEKIKLVKRISEIRVLLGGESSAGNDKEDAGEDEEPSLLADKVDKMPASSVQAMSDSEYESIYSKFEDANFHTNNMLLEAKRIGDDQLINLAEALLARHEEDGEITGDVYESIYKPLYERLKDAKRERQKSNAAQPEALPTNLTNATEELASNGGMPINKPVKRPTADFYPDSIEQSASRRQKANTAAATTLDRVNSGELNPENLTHEDKKALAAYSGNGGGLVGVDGKVGSPYEYYTPKVIADASWELLKGAGFTGGKVLDPCAGVGIFGSLAPNTAVVDAIELDRTSGGINKVLNGDNGSVVISPFEAIAANTPDNTHDAVITNIPFGDNAMRGANKNLDPKYRDLPLEGYFILRSLDKLKPGGTAVFISSSSFVSGKGYGRLRRMAALKGEFLGAYRLPNAQDTGAKTKKGNAKESSTFAGADVTSDVLVFRKHGESLSDKIQEIEKSGDVAGLLVESNVLWTTFLDGRYFAEDGKRFILGEQTTGMGQYGEVNRIVSGKPIAETAAIMKEKPFRESRINAALLLDSETEDRTPETIYKEGDHLYVGGQMFVMKDGAFVASGKRNEDSQLDADIAQMQSPLHVIQSGATLDSVTSVRDEMRKRSRHTSIPAWMNGVVSSLDSVATESNRQELYNLFTTAMAVKQVYDQHSSELPFNFAETYPALTDKIKEVAYSNRKPISGTDGDVRAALMFMSNLFDGKELSPVWSGSTDDSEAIEPETQARKYDNIRYTEADSDGFISLARFKEVMPDVDPLTTDEYCLSPDGKRVMSAGDFYAGKYADFLQKHGVNVSLDGVKARIGDGATDEYAMQVQAKLMRQMELASDRLIRVKVSDLKFNLASPFVDVERKVEYLNRYIKDAAGGFSVDVDDEGKPFIAYKESKAGLADAASEEEFKERKRNIARFADYLKRGSLSTHTAKEDKASSPKLEEMRQERLLTLIGEANQQFDSWARANPSITQAIEARLNDPANLFFAEEEETAPLDIPNINPKFVPHSYQNASIRRYARRMSGILGHDVGLGKAQPLDAKVLTPHGWVRMGDVNVGDMVMGKNGKPTTVTGVFPQGIKEIFEVRFSDGAKTRCCNEHLWSTQTQVERNYTGKIKSGLITKPVASKVSGVRSLAEIRESLVYEVNGSANHSIPMVSPVEFATKETPIHPYLLGVLLGDGNLTNHTPSISINGDDSQIYSRVCSLVPDGVTLNGGMDRSGANCASYRLTSGTDSSVNPVTVGLRKYGLYGTKSDTKFIPDDYLFNSVENRLMLLQGLMDTDGYAAKSGVTTQYSSTSKMLADGVVFLVNSLGGNATITSKIPSYKGVSGECIKCKLSYTVNIRMPSSINPFLLDRKADKVKPKTKYVPVRYISSVESVGFEEAQCISVDSEDHLYVTDDFIVTHNTAQSLLTAQHIQSIGVKKKTMFVVPNATLSNWRKEAVGIYLDSSDCLFIGLDIGKDDGGKETTVVKSSNYGRDLMKVLENKHRKIFISESAFGMIPIKGDTQSNYIDYVGKVDASFSSDASNKKRDEIKADGKKDLLVLGDKNKSFPYFEDLGVDSLVLDEAHMYKNSKATLDFKSAKQLSTPTASARGLDMQVKSWWIRNRSKLGDGVLALTATPITNSPLEMYSMLSLATGEEELNARLGGIRGADQFMEAFCKVEETTAENLIGEFSMTRLFTGLTNTQMLNKVLHGVANVRNAKDVNLKIPEYDEVPTRVALPEQTVAKLMEMKAVYAAARKLERELKKDDKDIDLIIKLNAQLKPYMDATGETVGILAHPFNLINKMSKMILDEDLAAQSTVYLIEEGQVELATKAVEMFNKLQLKIDRPEGRLTPVSGKDRTVLSKKTTKDPSSGDDVVFDVVRIDGFVRGNKVLLDSDDFEVQNKFMAIAKKLGLNLDVSVSAKMSAFLDNLKAEMSTPKSPKNPEDKPRTAKQIVFCDFLGMQNKVKLAIQNRCGIPSGKIMVVNGVSIGDPSQMQDVQDGFNAEGDENSYSVVIANKKAEVGINLQKGCQAIHHLSIGWTPDSLQQRNGRGVRQGNYVERMSIYHYDADGTFDEYKRDLVGVKSDWIGTLLSRENTGDITVGGSLSQREMEELADATGDADAVRRIREQKAIREAADRKRAAKSEVVSGLASLQGHQDTISKYREFRLYISEKLIGALRAQKSLMAARKALAKEQGAEKQNPAKIAQAQNKIINSEKLVERLSKPIGDSLKFKINNNAATASFSEFFSDDKLIDSIIKDGYIQYAPSVYSVKTGKYTNDYHSIYENESSALKNLWNEEVGIASNMVDEITKKAEDRADDVGISKERIAAIKDRKSVVYRGKIIGVGDFVESGKDLYIISRISGDGQHELFAIDYKTGAEIPGTYALLSSGELIVREDDGYASAVKRAAVIDNAVIEKSGGVFHTVSYTGSVHRDKTLYSHYSSDIQMLVNIDTEHYQFSGWHSFSDIILKSPAYPMPIKPGSADGSAVIQMLIDSQSAAISENEGGYKVRIDAIERINASYHSNKPRSEEISGSILLKAISKHVKIPLDMPAINGIQASAIVSEFLKIQPQQEKHRDVLLRLVNSETAESEYAKWVRDSLEKVFLLPESDSDLVARIGSDAYLSRYVTGSYCAKSELDRRIKELVAKESAGETVVAVAPEPIKEVAPTPVNSGQEYLVSADGKYGAIKFASYVKGCSDEFKEYCARKGDKAQYHGTWAIRALPEAPKSSWVARIDLIESYFREYPNSVTKYNIVRV